MLDFEISETNIATLRPHGALSSSDFAKLTSAIDAYINENDKVPSLLIDAERMPHWDSLGAMRDHLHFVRNHHKLVKKVAFVGDTTALKILPLIADHFVSAKVRWFSSAKLDDAKRWAESSEDHPGAFEPIPGLPSDTIGVELQGIITSQDYRDMLVPLVDEKLNDHESLKILILAGDRFESYSERAAWDDIRFGFSHRANFSHIALVTDIGWLRHGAKLFAPLMKADLHLFDISEFDDAVSWIKAAG